MSASEVDVGRPEIVEALVVWAIIVVVHEGCDLGFEVPPEEVVFQEAAVLQCLLPAFDLTLRLRMTGSAVDLVDLVFLQPFTEIGSDVTRAVVGQQAWPEFIDRAQHEHGIGTLSGRTRRVPVGRLRNAPLGKTMRTRVVAEASPASKDIAAAAIVGRSAGKIRRLSAEYIQNRRRNILDGHVWTRTADHVGAIFCDDPQHFIFHAIRC